MNTAPLPISREEWIQRYAARVVQQAGWTQNEASEAANAGAILLESEAQQEGRQPVWAEPEAAADEEMSYWDNDEADS